MLRASVCVCVCVVRFNFKAFCDWEASLAILSAFLKIKIVNVEIVFGGVESIEIIFFLYRVGKYIYVKKHTYTTLKLVLRKTRLQSVKVCKNNSLLSQHKCTVEFSTMLYAIL